MGYRNNERTDWEQVLTNLLFAQDGIADAEKRLTRSFQGLEHLVVLLVHEVAADRRLPLADELRAASEKLDAADTAQEPLRRLEAVLRSLGGQSQPQEEPDKALQRGFHWLAEIGPLRRGG